MTGTFTDRTGGTEKQGENDRLEAVGVSRRTVLQGVTVGAVAGLAGCTDDDDDSSPGGPVLADPTEPDDGPHYEGSLESQRIGGYSMRALARRMDSARTPNRLGGVPRSDREDAPPNDPDVDDWHQGGETAKDLAADFGLYHAENKGILDTYRDASNSIRDALDRHVGPDSTIHKMLVYNAHLVVDDEGDRDARAKDIGRMIGREGYDIVALNEVFSPDYTEDIYERVQYEGHSDWEEAFGPPAKAFPYPAGLYNLVGGDDRSLGERTHGTFSNPGTWADIGARKGWLHMEVDLGPGTIDLFSTHTNSGDGNFATLSRRKQIEELTDAMSERQSNNPENVTMAVGDFNVYSEKPELEWFLEHMWVSCDLRDVWLTRGGQASSTFGPGPWDQCTYEPDECACNDYNDDDYGSNRYDYVFVQDPQPEHDMRVDLTRLRRRPFPRKEPCGDVDPDGNVEYEYMSDHLGLDFQLIASPK